MSTPFSPACAARPRLSAAWASRCCLLALACCLTTGCVHRRLMVRSNPAGAVVYVDNREIGTTPCAVNFTYYGTREIRLVKDGFETLKDRVHIRPPWYQLPPLDFVSENVVPWEINDQRNISYQLEPQLVVPNEELLRRGDDLRRAAGAPSGPITPVGGMPAPLPAPNSTGPAFPPAAALPPR